MNKTLSYKWKDQVLCGSNASIDDKFITTIQPFKEANLRYNHNPDLIMAVDCGKKHWGLAVSDATFTLARPLSKISNKNLLDQLIEYLVKYKICALIWGMPGSYFVSASDPMKAHVIEQYYNLQKKIINTDLLPAGQYFMDEHSSSKEAMQQLQNMGYDLSTSITLKDAMSAAHILQLALDLL